MFDPPPQLLIGCIPGSAPPPVTCVSVHAGAVTHSLSMEQCESAASLLREQEVQFERLTRALEEERRRAGPPSTFPHPFPYAKNSCVSGDAEIERLKINEGYINGTQYRMLDPGQVVEETVTVEEDPQDAPAVSVETDEVGNTRRTETTVKKVVKTVTTRTVIPSVQGRGRGGGLPHLHRATKTTTMAPQRGTRTTGPDPPSEAYPSLSRGARMDERYRPVVDGYRTLDSGYSGCRVQLDPYGAQPQVRMGSNVDLRRFIPEPYGLEDDQRSLGYDEPDYGMAPAHTLRHRPPAGPRPPRAPPQGGEL
ncbi:hypothetical protein SKAU_G00320160 [Synaphobranchus kaupii]|uniref:Uncharacterized protein n=1 Tax=Synaphobranchus kaupii TaxID=118154 RepID=A0A9Q1IHJ2_SYNKA|nr:hypothetical protein SKAU_G00320160 [Synaphobranchus kaupii]